MQLAFEGIHMVKGEKGESLRGKYDFVLGQGAAYQVIR
jgi:hypothetical protein